MLAGDNTAAAEQRFCLTGATPGSFQAWLETAIAETKRDCRGTSVSCSSSLEEWAEGAFWSQIIGWYATSSRAKKRPRDAAFVFRTAGG